MENFEIYYYKMADNEQKALQLIAEAEKILTTNKGLFGSMFGCVWRLFQENSMESQLVIWLVKIVFMAIHRNHNLISAKLLTLFFWSVQCNSLPESL